MENSGHKAWCLCYVDVPQASHEITNTSNENSGR